MALRLEFRGGGLYGCKKKNTHVKRQSISCGRRDTPLENQNKERVTRPERAGTGFSGSGGHYRGRDLGSQFSRNATLSTTSITILKLLDGKLKMSGKDEANG